MKLRLELCCCFWLNGILGGSRCSVLAFQSSGRDGPRSSWTPWTRRRHYSILRANTWSTRTSTHLAVDSAPSNDLDDHQENDDRDDDWGTQQEKAYGNRSLSWTNRYRKLLPYEYARNLVMSLGLRSREEWEEQIKGPYVPNRPDEMYADDWVSWDEFLGIMRSYDETQYIVQQVLHLGSMDEYTVFVEADKKRAEGLRIPAKPDVVYRGKGWVSFDHFFGINSDDGSGAQNVKRN